MIAISDLARFSTLRRVIGKVEASTRTFALRPAQQMPFMLIRETSVFTGESLRE